MSSCSTRRVVLATHRSRAGSERRLWRRGHGLRGGRRRRDGGARRIGLVRARGLMDGEADARGPNQEPEARDHRRGDAIEAAAS